MCWTIKQVALRSFADKARTGVFQGLWATLSRPGNQQRALQVLGPTPHLQKAKQTQRDENT